MNKLINQNKAYYIKHLLDEIKRLEELIQALDKNKADKRRVKKRT